MTEIEVQTRTWDTFAHFDFGAISRASKSIYCEVGFDILDYRKGYNELIGRDSYQII